MRRPLPQSDDYARWLSQIAECLALVQAQSALDLGLAITPLPGGAGIRVWDDRANAAVLQVDAQGTVLHYAAGRWEQRLIEARRQAGDPIQGTLDLAGWLLAEESEAGTPPPQACRAREDE